MYYQLDLWAELEGPRLRWGRLVRLLRQLPADAALWRSLDAERATWTLDRHLLAGIFDLLALANWQRGGAKRKDRPKPFPRPGVSGPKRVGDASRLTPAKARELLDSRKPRR